MSFKITNYGHSCILIESVNGKKILFDPYLSENESAAIKPEDIKELDAILVSHGAFDHLGDALPIAKNTGAPIYCDPAVADYAVYHGLPKEQIKMLVWGTCLDLGDTGITVRSIEAKHLSYFKIGDQKFTGIPMSFILTLEDGTAIYFAGDTSIFTDMKLFGQLYNVKYGMFGITGLEGYPYEMDAREGAIAADLFGVKYAIPIHYPAGSSAPFDFKNELGKINPDIETVILETGIEYTAE